MRSPMIDCLERSPIIAAVKNDRGLERVLAGEHPVVFLLYGDVVSLLSLIHI